MKALKHKLALTLAFLPLCAFAGPGTDGGNVFRSSEAEVRAAVDSLKQNVMFGLLSEAQTRQLLNAKYVQDEELKSVLRSMDKKDVKKGSGVWLVLESMSSKFEPKPSCRDAKGHEVDASTELRRTAPICFNMKRLRRFPADQLKLELANLALHELTHHFGYNDKIAYKFQSHMREFVKNFFQLNGIRNGFSNLEYLEMRPGGEVQFLGKSGKVTVACVNGDAKAVDLLNLLNKGRTILLSGEFLLQSANKGAVAISCRKYPVIDCEDYIYAKNPADLTRAIRAGICKNAASSAVPGEAEPVENTSAE